MVSQWHIKNYSHSDLTADGAGWTHLYRETEATIRQLFMLLHNTMLVTLRCNAVYDCVNLVESRTQTRAFTKDKVLIIATRRGSKTSRMRFKFALEEDCKECCENLARIVPVAYYGLPIVEHDLVVDTYNAALASDTPPSVPQTMPFQDDRELEEYIRLALMDPEFINTFLEVQTAMMEMDLSA